MKKHYIRPTVCSVDCAACGEILAGSTVDNWTRRNTLPEGCNWNDDSDDAAASDSWY